MRRNILPILVLLLVLTVLGAFAYFSRAPNSPALVQAEQWAYVGDYVRQFRQAYGPPEEEATWKPPKTEVVVLKPPGLEQASKHGAMGVDGTQSPSEPYPVETFPLPRPIIEQRWFLPGQPLYSAAIPGGEPVQRLSSLARLPVLTVEGPWLEVLFATESRWINSSWRPERSAEQTEWTRDHRPWAYDRLDSGRLNEAKRLLQVDGPIARIGPHEVYSDIDNPRLIDQLRAAIELAPVAYAGRFGRLPGKAPEWRIVIFDREADYRTFVAETSNPLPDRARGHAEGGFVAFYLEGQSLAEFLTTITHEQAHLLNRLSLSRTLPTWLEEGLATDLGLLWVEDYRALVTDLYGQEGADRANSWETGILRLQALLKEPEPPSLVELMNLDFDRFYENADWAYSYSGGLVRFLLDGKGGAYSEAFRGFLGGIARGGQSDSETLLERLRTDGPALDREFAQWVEKEAALAKERTERQMAQHYRDQWAIEQHEKKQRADAGAD